MTHTQNDYTSRAVTAFLVLRTTQLNHVLRCRVCDIDFTQNRVPVVCQSAFRLFRISEAKN